MALSVMCFFSLCCFRHTNIMDDTMISPPPITDVFELASRPLCPLSFVVCVVCFGWLFCVGVVFVCVLCFFLFWSLGTATAHWTMYRSFTSSTFVPILLRWPTSMQ